MSRNNIAQISFNAAAWYAGRPYPADATTRPVMGAVKPAVQEPAWTQKKSIHAGCSFLRYQYIVLISPCTIFVCGRKVRDIRERPAFRP